MPGRHALVSAVLWALIAVPPALAFAAPPPAKDSIALARATDLKKSELRAVYRIEVAHYQDPLWTWQRFKDTLSRDKTWLALARDGRGKIVGFLHYRLGGREGFFQKEHAEKFDDRRYDGKTLYLENFNVAKRHQGRGIGSKLLGIVLEEGKRAGLERVLADTDRDNPVVRLNRRFGFRVQARYTDGEPTHGYSKPTVRLLMGRKL